MDLYSFILAGLCLLSVGLNLCLYRALAKRNKNKKDAVQPAVPTVAKAGREAETAGYKLNPHLLKNVLNSIQSHAYQSYNALDKLSSVLDYILYESDGKFVDLKEELRFALNLIEINRLKTSPLFNLSIKNKISKENPWYENGQIAPFITINPIENAFMHADLQSENAFISVLFDIRVDHFLLSVSNKIGVHQGNHPLRGGLGNRTFASRLKSIYGPDYELSQTDEDGIYRTELKIKLREKAD